MALLHDADPRTLAFGTGAAKPSDEKDLAIAWSGSSRRVPW